ncbi:MAG: peptidoglycan DD-metalloendopeptidase family protein [Tuberibacillus sp.]
MSRVDEIRKRHKERKNRITGLSREVRGYSPRDGYPVEKPHGYGLSVHPPTPRSQTFIIKCIVAAALVLGTGIYFKNAGHSFPKVEKVIRYAMNEDVNFAKVSDWYEKQFGEPLALFPSSSSTNKASSNEKGFAVPVSGGTVTQTFSDTNQGVLIQTESDAKVDAIENGFVVSVGQKKGIGKTVVIRHNDGTESWYGKLDAVNVKPYDFVKKEQNIGTVAKTDGQKNGTFYFALKEGDHFVDPIQVIKFD